MTIFANISPFYIFAAVALVLIVLVGVLLFIELRNSGRMQRLTYPIYDYTIKKAQKKARKIIWDATQKAREMLVEAELKSIRSTAEKKLEHRDLEETYRQRLDAVAEDAHDLLTSYRDEAKHSADRIASQVEQTLQTHTDTITQRLGQVEERASTLLSEVEQKAEEVRDQYGKLTTSLESTASRRIKEYEEAAQAEIDEMTRTLKQSLGRLEETQKEKINAHLNEEFETTQEVIDEYRRKQYALVDKHIVALVERVAAIALQKELSVKEHTDLVRQALEEARSEGVFGGQESSTS